MNARDSLFRCSLCIYFSNVKMISIVCEKVRQRWSFECEQINIDFGAFVILWHLKLNEWIYQMILHFNVLLVIRNDFSDAIRQLLRKMYIYYSSAYCSNRVSLCISNIFIWSIRISSSSSFDIDINRVKTVTELMARWIYGFYFILFLRSPLRFRCAHFRILALNCEFWNLKPEGERDGGSERGRERYN